LEEVSDRPEYVKEFCFFNNLYKRLIFV
jgi:hypothetical protein